MNQKESPDRPEAPVRLHWPGKDSDDVPLPAAVDGKLVEVTALSAGFKDSGNVIVHGDNLAVMKLMEPSLKGTVDCIYTDPPYNTRSRFRFYSDDMGHSDWLAAIRDRLECMQTLLANDGSIWVSADDNECHYLKVLMDEVFGRANFITNIIWKKHYLPDLSARHFSVEHDHILVYARDASRWTLEGNRDGADTDSDRPPTIWDHTEVGHTTEARQEVVALFDGDVFETPKPER
ncbi:MAG: site-specific DNA-methyltransferase, partial [bacterium]|nr:site-specific DNA-methyltransferase [bacterium]